MTLPPYATLLGVTPEFDEHGAPVLLLPFGDHVVGRPGFLHGGAIAGLLELAALAALRHALAAEGAGEDGGEVGIKPVTFTTDFQRGGRDKDTRAAGAVTRLGTRVANVEAVAWQDDRTRPVASARMNCLLQRHRPG
ncbi:PaaI family thioesterase [Sphingomonas rubra]|uniref:Acyl-coenzyme A thioesterase PaaI, contains HGG motif n=1 Tax=Sphingomonas rubra TaxID=634430 RepID=A0A1I5UC37_9SPHN|nr:hotdog domain-containing protein [Sphingomonas rubra]SFP92814.1 Acyl-coenzyme A thioesterase PaaI, contains HGG motif [Sphingomonas rubra]